MDIPQVIARDLACRMRARRSDQDPVPRRPAGPDRSVPELGGLLRLQRLAGNAAVVASVQRQSHDAGSSSPGVVHPGRFLNSGTSQLGRALGFHGSGQYYVNGIEIVFDLDPGVRARYSALRPRQWSGPEAVFFKTGPPLGSRWQTQSRGEGAGPDDPQPESQRVTDTAVIYDDSPGASVLGHLGHTWVHAVQNFTGWVEGKPRKGGDFQRLTEVVAWHSVLSIVNPQAADGGTSYQPMGFTTTGTGWVPTVPPNL